MNINLKKKCWLWGISATVLALSACKKQDQESDDEQERGATAEIKIPSIGYKVRVGGAIQGWLPYTRRDRQIRMRDADFILHGIVRKKFDNLDAFVAEFDCKYPGGVTYRSQFYDKFENYDDYNRSNAGRYHDKYLNNLKVWAAENQEKGEPMIAMAGFEIYLAWYARGDGFARTVTDQGWERFHTHIGNARKILENAPAVAKKDPHYYRLWITIHLAQGGNLEEVQNKFEEGQNTDPTYSDLYYGMTNYLQPKWHGESIDDWHKWLVAALKHSKLSDDDRLVLYGALVRGNIRGGTMLLMQRLRQYTESMELIKIDSCRGLQLTASAIHHHRIGQALISTTLLRPNLNQLSRKHLSSWTENSLLVFLAGKKSFL